MKHTLIALFAAALLAPATVLAQDLSYNYFEISYDDYDFGMDGFSVGGSFAFGENLHGILGYSRASNGFSFDGIVAGIGWAHNITASSDFVLRGGVNRISNGISDTDFFIEAGIRGMITDNFELNGFLLYSGHEGDTSLGNGFRSADPGLRIGGVYNFGVSSGVTFGFDDDSSWTIGYRHSF